MPQLVLFGVVFVVFLLVVITRLRSLTSLDPQMPRDMAEVQRLAASGQLIPAIKLHRELTGLGLKESKDAVEAMARGAITGSIPAPYSTGPNSEADARILVLLRERRDIEAIKLHRETYGVGLKESKDAIDRLKAGL